jgi:hypothetical protein
VKYRAQASHTGFVIVQTSEAGEVPTGIGSMLKMTTYYKDKRGRIHRYDTKEQADAMVTRLTEQEVKVAA